ncbi:MAG: ABC transporter substrate-binding protein [Actinomycetota bacterium]
MKQPRRVSTRAAALAAVVAVVAASCGGGDDSSEPSSTDASAATAGDVGSDSTVVDSTEPPTTESPTTDAGSDDDVSAGDVAEGDVDTSIVENVDTVTYGGDIIVALEAEAQGLRPWEDAAPSAALNILHAIYDPLMAPTADGAFEPYLAESLEPNADFTEWTMRLRPDVTFSDGTPLTAQTIADMFPIQQTGATASAAVSSVGLIGVDAIDDLEVVYRLSAPNSAFPSVLWNPTLGMPFVPELAAADPAGYNANPIGTGPFTLESRDLDNETIVVRRDDYWMATDAGDQLPYLDSISFRPIPDESTRLDALISGSVTAMTTLRQGTIRDSRAQSGLTLVEFQGNNTGGGMFNTAIAPLDDVRVRRALLSMINQDGLIDATGGTGISLPATQWFSPDDPFWTQEAADAYPDFDFDLGVALLEEYVNDPGRSDGKATGEPIDVTLSCPPDPTLIAAMQVMEQVWTGSGLVNVTLNQFDQATHISNAIGDQHLAHCWRWGGQSDPGVMLSSFVADPAESVANFPNYLSPRMQEAVAAANATDDFEERRALFSQVMQEISNEALLWYGGHTAVMIATADDVQGLNSWELPSGSLGIGIPDALGIWSQVFVSP